MTMPAYVAMREVLADAGIAQPGRLARKALAAIDRNPGAFLDYLVDGNAMRCIGYTSRRHPLRISQYAPMKRDAVAVFALTDELES